MARNTGHTIDFSSAVYNGFAPEKAFHDASSGSGLNTAGLYFASDISGDSSDLLLTPEEKEAKRARETAEILAAAQIDDQEPKAPLFNRIVNTVETGVAFASYLIGPSLLSQFNTGTAITFTPSGNNTPFNAAAAPSTAKPLTSPIALTTGLGAPNNPSGASGNTSAPSSNIS